MRPNLKPKSSGLPGTVTQKSRLDSERISYSNETPPTRQTWKERPEYEGSELAYRGKVSKSILTLSRAS